MHGLTGQPRFNIEHKTVMKGTAHHWKNEPLMSRAKEYYDDPV